MANHILTGALGAGAIGGGVMLLIGMFNNVEFTQLIMQQGTLAGAGGAAVVGAVIGGAVMFSQ